jgi:hypothetical protein
VVGTFINDDGLNFTIPYLHNGKPSEYLPDFVIRLSDGLGYFLIVEVKGGGLGWAFRGKGAGWPPLVRCRRCHWRTRSVGVHASFQRQATRLPLGYARDLGSNNGVGCGRRTDQ